MKCEAKPTASKNADLIIAEIKEIIEEIRFYIKSDGGDLEFVNFDFTSGQLTIKIFGACVGCAMIDHTYKHGVETILKSEIPEVKSLVIIESEE